MTGQLSTIEQLNRATVIKKAEVGSVTDALYENIRNAQQGLTGVPDSFEFQRNVPTPDVISRPGPSPLLSMNEINANLGVGLGADMHLASDKPMLPEDPEVWNKRDVPFDPMEAIFSNLDEALNIADAIDMRETMGSIPEPLYVHPPVKGYFGFEIPIVEDEVLVPVANVPTQQRLDYRTVNPLFEQVDREFVGADVSAARRAYDVDYAQRELEVARAQRVNAPEIDLGMPAYRVRDAISSPYDSLASQSAPRDVVISADEKTAFARMHDLRSPAERIAGERDRRAGG